MHNTSTGIRQFGPVFNKKFLLAVYDLQQQILQVIRKLDKYVKSYIKSM